MADAPEVKIKLTAEDQGVAAAIRQLTQNLNDLKSKQSEVADSAGDLSEAFKGLLAVVAVDKIAEFGEEVFDAGVKIARLSQSTGISTETLSTYAQAAKDTGTNVDAMQSGIARLAGVLTQAEQGSQRGAKALALVGLSTKDFVGLNADQKIQKVVDAIAKMPPGFQKTAAAEKLLGDVNLLPALQQLAGDGFDKTREAAEQFGNVLSTDGAEKLLAMEESLKTLKAEAEGAVQSFEIGFIPALTQVANAIGQAVAGKNADGFEKLGERAGAAFKEVAAVIASVGISVGTTAAEVEEIFDFLWNHTRESAQTAFAAVKGYITGGVGGAAASAATQLATATDSATVEFTNRIKAIEDQASAAQQKLYETLNAPPPEVKKPASTGTNPELVDQEAQKSALKAQQQADEIFKLNLASLIKEQQSELEITKATAAGKEATEKAAFDRGEISLKTYNDDRLATLTAAGQAELAELTRQKADQQTAIDRFTAEAAQNSAKAKSVGETTPVGQEFAAQAAKDNQEVLKAKQSIADLDNKIALTEIQNETKVTELKAQDYKTELDQRTKIAEFQKQELDIQGKTSDAAKVEAAAKEAEYRQLLTSQLGAGNPQIEKEIDQYRTLTTAAAAFNDAQKAAATEQQQFDEAKAAINQQVASGQIFEVQGVVLIRQAETARLAQMKLISAELQKQAALTGNKADIQAANNYAIALQGVQLQTNLAAQDVAQLKNALQTGLTQGLETFFTTGLTQSRSMGQAFAALADTIVSSLQKMAAQILTNIIVTKLLKAAQSELGGFSGGGEVSFPGLASGGHVRGPGTATSDSIPARLSDGEFVMRAAAVRAIGVGTLNAMNRGMAMGLQAPAAPAAPNAFAGGGLVGSGSGGGDSRHVLEIGMEEGMFVKHLKSSGAGKVVISHIANNPKAATKAIGRSS
jgi:hypothetical protein